MTVFPFFTLGYFRPLYRGLLVLGMLSSHPLLSQTEYDIVLAGGRVIDPETQLDAIRNVGIIDGKIREISSETLEGKERLDVSGLVVSPGFIDLHVHGITNAEQAYQVRDGVTSALELEWGVPMLAEWYKSRESKALINYGASVNWALCRTATMERLVQANEELRTLVAEGKYKGVGSMLSQFMPTLRAVLSDEQIKEMNDQVKRQLDAGGVGIGVPVGYIMGATRKEVYRLYQRAGELQAPIFTHVREGGTIAIQQAISDAILTDAPLHIVHINSMALGEIALAMEMVQDAQEKGFDITTEVYPYTAASTGIETAIFNEGWQERLAISYKDVQWVATGERLTKETFEKYREQGGTVIIHMMQAEWIQGGIATEGVIIASDGMFYAPLAHPRTAGTFSRVLGKYVREEKVVSLPVAIAKMTYLPAKRIESIAPTMRFKGRIQVGADADISVFDPNTIIDKATFEGGLAFSEGISHVLVNGVFVVKNGETVKGVFPGQPIYGRYRSR